MSSRNGPPHKEGVALRDDTQNGCVADQENADSGIYSNFGYTAGRVVVKVNSPEKEKNNNAEKRERKKK